MATILCVIAGESGLYTLNWIVGTYICMYVTHIAMMLQRRTASV